MHIKEQGFILQPCFSHDQQVAVLTRSRGRLKMQIKSLKKHMILSPGTRIDFILEGDRFLYARDVEVMSVPVVQDKRDIVWIHHWLEVATYFSQPELSDDRLFKSLEVYFVFLARRQYFNDLDALGVMCVFHCLYQTGFYEDYLFVRYKKILTLLSSVFYFQDFDEILHDLAQSVNNLTINEIKQIEFFVLQCLQKHPLFKLFKTARFIYV